MARGTRKRTYGTGSIYKQSRKWIIRWREGGRARVKGGFTSREIAERVLRTILGDIERGQFGLARDPKSVPTLALLAKEWLERRTHTHRSATDDKGRWNNHLKDFFGSSRPSEVDPAAIRRFIESKLAEGLNPNTVGNCVRLLSTFYTDLVERDLVRSNPVRSLPRATRRLYKPSHDPKTTPFLKSMADVRAVFLKLPETVNVPFAVGALAGLRTGEVLGLLWSDIDLEARRIHVQRQVKDSQVGPLKDDESRVVPIQAPLAPILKAWKLKTGGKGFVFRPTKRGGGRPGSPPTFINPHTLWDGLREALAACELPSLTWYQATRHTFASQWALAGGSIMRLSKILGHSSIEVTERYAHLLPDSFTEAEHSMLEVDLSIPEGKVIATEQATNPKIVTRLSHGQQNEAAVDL